MNWDTVVANAGIAGFVLLFIMKAHRDLVYVILPERAAQIEKRLAEIELKQEQRHAENRRDSKKLCLALTRFANECVKKKHAHHPRRRRRRTKA